MKQRKLVLAALAGCIGLGVLISCGKSNDNNGGGVTPGKSDSTLTNLGTNIILPAYQQLATNVAAMDAAINTFTATPTADNLVSAQAAFKTAYTSYESTTQFEFGPAIDQSMVTTIINVFPTDTSTIHNNIATGTFTIDGLSNFKAQGFPALDFLLFGAVNAKVVANFSTDANAANAKKYLTAVSASLKSKTAAVLIAWSATGGNYLGKFIAATGVDAGSSLSLLINAYVYDYDVILKNYKLGIPIGKYGATTIPQDPAKVEAYYSGISLQLLNAELQSVQNVYLGGTGLGLDDKVAATNAQSNGGSLNDAIKNELTTVIAKVKAVPGPLSASITNNAASVNDAYTEVSKFVVLIKVDMSSALGVKISFSDDDGD